MKVFRIRPQPDLYPYIVPVRADDWTKLRTNAYPRATSWSPPVVSLAHPERGTANFLSRYSDTLIVDQRVMDEVGGDLEMAGEVLPLPYGNIALWVINVLECVDALDHERTVWTNDASGNHISRYSFHLGRIPFSSLFKIPETCEEEILISFGQYQLQGEFYHKVQQAHFTGVAFEEIWTDSSSES